MRARIPIIKIRQSHDFDFYNVNSMESFYITTDRSGLFY